MNKIIRRRDPGAATELGGRGLHPLLARIYAARGVSSSAELELGLSQLLPPAALLNAGIAAARLADAIADDERMLVIGDFDADGATSTALVVSALRESGASRVDYLVPNRFEYGYGLTPGIVGLAGSFQPDLIITVDNGISSLEGVAAARAAGIATLITDHHLPGHELPAADIIVNPSQPGCGFASKNLAGVGVIFYVMLALRAELRTRNWYQSRGIAEPRLADYLDLVALGTVADVVPLDHNNRILVAGGLQRIRAGKARPGILALLEIAARNPASAVAADLGFSVGPRLNAAGRLDDMSLGIECLLSTDWTRARHFAAQLHALNLDRREIEQTMQQQALAALDTLQLGEGPDLPRAVTLYQPDWHQGVIGILASRIKDRLHRPVIVFADGDAGQIKGSARSIPGVHIRDILDTVASRHPGLIEKFGGHAMAAGLALPRNHYAEFSEAFVAEVTRHSSDIDLQAVIESDGELPEIDLDLGLASILRYEGPWGQHFPEPVFDGRFRLIQQRIVGDKHLKMVLMPLAGTRCLDAIAFNVDTGRWPDESVTVVELAYRLDVNDYRGRQSLQLLVEQLVAVA
jgi:single-stranded-DNA-specific exonuclease